MRKIEKYISYIDPFKHIIVYPTDTVYGIGGDPFNQNIVNRVFHLKRRKASPFPILISEPEYAFNIALVNRLATKFIESFWPGKLTIVVKAKYSFPAILGSKYVGLRMPDHSRLIKLIDHYGGLLIGTSANISGLPPSTTYLEAFKYFGSHVDVYLVDDEAPSGIPSTVIKIVDEDTVSILRIGGVKLNMIRDVCKRWGCKYIVEGR